jgi:hypothetical protein
MKVLMVADTNLFRVAAEQLGDATQWIRIAVLNQLSDPFISGVVELRLPELLKSAGGGVVRQ